MTSADCIRRTACYQTYASLSSRRCLSIRSSLLPWVVGRAVVPHPASIRCCCDKLMSFSSVIRQSFHPIAAWSPPVRSSSPVYTRRLQLLQPPLFPFRPGLKADVQTTGRSINRIQVTTVSVAEDFMCLCGRVCGGDSLQERTTNIPAADPCIDLTLTENKTKIEVDWSILYMTGIFGYCRIKLVIAHPKYWYKSF